MVRQVLEVMDRAVEDLPESRRAPVRKHFTTSCYEWMFWDAGHGQETRLI